MRNPGYGNANKKDAEQTALSCSLISAIVVRSVYVYHINYIFDIK